MGYRSIFNLLLISFVLGAVRAIPPRTSLAKPHIVGGEEVDVKEIPYQVSIRKNFNHHCGASIIGKYYALSAAHCFDNSREWLTAYGVAGGSSHIKEGTYKLVRSIISHPKYDTTMIDYDLALVRLLGAFEFTDSMQKIELVAPGSSLETGTNLVVSGWGKTTEFAGPSEKLKRAEVKLIERSKCEELYPNLVTDRMFCAGVEDGSRDSCTGDSGGPIVDLNSGRQVGIVSWGLGCGRPNGPGVYTNLSNHEIRQFIIDNTEDL